MYRRVYHPLWSITVVCALFAIAATSLAMPRIASSQANPVMAAWEKARAANSYHFNSDVVQITIPSAKVTNVGRTSQTQEVHLEGQSDMAAQLLELQLWSQGGSVAGNGDSIGVRVDKGKTYTRRGTSEWRESEGMVDGIAPQGDFMAYLAAVKNVTTNAPETVAGITFTRYSFEIDGPTFAAFTRDQMEAAMRQKGELPVNMHIDLPAYYRDMTGDGELWVREDGLPLRQRLNLHFPEQKNESLHAQITVDFSKFGKGETLAAGNGSTVATLWNRFTTALPQAGSVVVTLPMVLFVAMLVVYRRSRRLERAISVALIASFIVGPTLSTLQSVAFYDVQSARAAAQEEQRKESDMQAALRTIDTEKQYNPHESLIASSLEATKVNNQLAGSNPQMALSSAQAAPLSATALTDSGFDSDGDGITDFVEQRIGTDENYFDSDDDTITDTVEINGFTYNGKKWYPNPLAIDSNDDSIADNLEWDNNGDNQPDDTDGDGVPDLFDEDNDNDGVPDRKDLSPFSSSNGTTLSEATPFQLTLRNLEANQPTFVDFQLRPINSDHLWFAFNVLDWPTDNQGQVQDIDGKTYADLALAEGRTAAPNESYGDMKLVPMLEIRIHDPVTNLPSAAELVAYNITTRTLTANGSEIAVYVPLSVVTDEKTGARAAFTGRMRYQPSGNWLNPHDVRLAWVVQALIDIPCNPNNADAVQRGCAADKYIHNQPQVLQTYYDDWTLTGMNVSEQHGASVATIYEDPAVDANLKDDGTLWLLSYGLDNGFLSGRDANGDTQRDVDLAEVDRRFDRTTNSGVSDDERWAVPNTLRVESQSYPTLDEAVMTTAMSETTRILTARFNSAWAGDNAIQPLLLYATEARTRAMGLDGIKSSDGYVTLSGRSAVVDMQPAGKSKISLTTVASLKWTAYCSAAGASPSWDACDMDARWAELESRHAATASQVGDPADPEIANGRMIVTQIYNLTLSQGLTQLVERNLRAVFNPASTLTDSQAANNVRSALVTTNRVVTFIANQVIMARYVNKMSVLQYLSVKFKRFLVSNPIGQAGVQALETIRNFRQNRLAATGLILGAAAVIGGLAALIYFAADGNAGAKIALKFLVLGLTTLLTLVDLVMTTRAWAQALSAAGESASLILSRGSEAIGLSRTASAIGTVIGIAIVWGFFIYSMVSNHVSAFSPEFNQALAETIAATIYLIVLAVLSATVVGAILVAILAVIDAVLMIICEAGVDDLKDVNGTNHGCFSIGGTIIKYIAKLLYAFDIMIDTDRDDLVVLGQPSMTLADPAKGMVTGNSITVQMPITTTVVHKDPDPTNWQILFYQWFYSRSNLRSSTVKYSLTQGSGAGIGVSRDDMSGLWQDVREDHKWVATPMYRGQAVSNHAPTVWNPQPGLNRSSDIYLNMGYAFPAYECWTLYIIYPIPVCYTRTLDDSSSQLFDSLNFDIFPNTLDGFMALSSEGDGGLGMSWDPAFRSLDDADGDGLRVSARGGLDPNDGDWDSDNDGLADIFELERRQAGVPFSPILIDTDNDGLTDMQEMQFGTNPGIADSDNDGLRDGEEVWHQVYNTSTGAATNTFAGGWDVIVGGTMTITVHVSSDPLAADGDGDGIDDLAEKQLAAKANPADRLDKQNRPYHPNIFNTPPIAIYSAIDDADGFVRPGQQVIFTNTVVASSAMAASVLDVNPSNAYANYVPPAALNFNPLTFSEAQTVTTAAALTIASLGSTQNVSLSSTVRARLEGSTGPEWVLDPIAEGAPLSGFTTKALGASVAASQPDRTDQYMVSAVASDSTAVGGHGDVWKYNVPSGGASTIESDNYNGVNDFSAFRGNTPPSVACNDAGDCLVVWDQVNNCNTLTIRSMRVDVAEFGDANGGIEPGYYITPQSQGTSGGGWEQNMAAGQSVAYNDSYFFCGSITLSAYEVDGGGSNPLVYNPVGNARTFYPQSFTNGYITFSQPEIYIIGNIPVFNRISFDVLIPSIEIHTLAGKFIRANGSTFNVSIPATGLAGTGHRYHPVVASDGSNFVVVSELARAAVPVDLTQLMAMQFDSNGNATGNNSFSQSFNRSVFASLNASATGLDIAWVGNEYNVAVDAGGDYDYISSFPIRRFAVSANGSSIIQLANVTADRLGQGEPLDISLSYDPFTGAKMFGYRNWAIYNTQSDFTFQNSIGANTQTFTKYQYAPTTAYNPINRGWLYSSVDLNTSDTVFGMTDAAQNRIGNEQRAFSGKWSFSSDLACPSSTALPVVDLRFEELPGATTFADSSGLGNNASYWTGTQPPAGLPGAVDANGIAVGTPASDYSLGLSGNGVRFTSPSLRDYTIAFWLKTNVSSFNTLVANSTAGFTLNTFAGTIQFTDNGQTITSGAINDNRWHYIVVSRQRSSGQARIFVDGAQAASGNLGVQGAYAGGNNTVIGFTSFNGQMDNFQLYQTALSAGAVQALYNRTMQAYCVATMTNQESKVYWAKVITRQPDYRGGKITASSSISFTVDADKPTSTLDSLRNNQYIRTTAGAPQIMTIGGNANDATSGVDKVEVAINGSYQATEGAESWAYNWAVSEGVYTLQSRATDAVGNVGDPSPLLTVIADATAPQIGFTAPISTIVPSRNITGEWTFSLSGTVSDPGIGVQPGSGLRSGSLEMMLEDVNATATVIDWQPATVNGTQWTQEYNFGNHVSEPTGSYTVTARAEDNVGNQVRRMLGVITLDSRGPETSFSVAGGVQQVISNTLLIGGDVSELETGNGGVNKLMASFVPINQVIPVADAVLMLRFDEATGAVFYADSSIFANDATCATLPDCPTAGGAGRSDKALQFNGQSLLSVADHASLNFGAGDSFSLQAWVKTSTGNNTMLFKGDAQRSWRLGLAANGAASFALKNENGSVSVSGGADLRNNQWHHLAAIVDRESGKANLFVDGQWVANQTVSGGYISQSDLFIAGQNGLPAQNFTGMLDQVVIVPHAWNSSEVEDLMLAADQLWLNTQLAQQNVTNLKRRTALSLASTPSAAVVGAIKDWSLQVPAGLEGDYQIDLLSQDGVGNRSRNGNVWRGVIDTEAPRLVITGTATGASYLDPRTDTRNYAVHYTCEAFDLHLDEASFDCPGSTLRPAIRSFENDETFKQLFPDWTIRSGLTLSYTVWQTNTVPNATLRACDTFGHCASASATGVAVPPVLNDMPFSVVITPTEGTYVASSGLLSVTIAAEAAHGLKDVALLLDSSQVDLKNFDQAQNTTAATYSVGINAGSEGEHLLETQATDWLGNVQTTFYQVRFILDTQVPTATLTTKSLTMSDTYETGSGILRFRGQANDTLCLAAVQIKVGSMDYMDVAFADGNWSAAVPTNGPEGASLPVSVRALDCAGQVTSLSQNIVTDLTNAVPPSTTITSGPTGEITVNSASFAFTGEAGDNPVVGYQCHIDDETYVSCNTGQYTSVNLSEGDHTFYVRAVDELGNADPTPATRSFFVNAIAREVTIDSKPTDPTASHPVSFTFSGEPDVVGFKCIFQGILNGCTSPSSYGILHSGSYTFKVRGYDEWNVLGPVVSYSFTVTNDAPIAASQWITISEDITTSLTLTATDVNGDLLTYAVVDLPQHGELGGIAPNLVYTPSLDFNGTDSFTFKTNDSETDSLTATVTIDITAVNDDPIADAQFVATDEDTSLAITLTASDVDGDVLTYTVVTSPTHGELSGIAPDLVYTPSLNFNGADAFTFLANDGLIDSAVVTVTIAITPVNDVSVASSQTITTEEDTPLSITLTSDDIDGDVLIYRVVTTPTNGELGGIAPDIIYTPSLNFNGADGFTFLTNDGLVDSALMTVTIDVLAVNDAPVADAQLLAGDEDMPISMTLTASDVEGDLLTYTVVTSPTHGELSGIAPDLLYTPSLNFNGTDAFTFIANDGLLDSVPVTVTIEVTAVNDVSVASSQSLQTDEDTPLAITLSAGDVDGDVLTYTVVASPTNGELGGEAPNLVYTPSANFNGGDGFTFQTNDGVVDSEVMTVTLAVLAVNDAPLAFSQVLTTSEDTPISVTLSGSDIEGEGLSFAIVDAPQHGTLTGTAPDLVYAPSANFNGTDSFTFKANDGVADSAMMTVMIAVLSVNDAPQVNVPLITTDEDTSVSVTLVVTDADGDLLNYAVGTPPQHGELSGIAPNFVYTPTANFHGEDSFTLTTDDGVNEGVSASSVEAVTTVTVTIQVEAVNDAPVAQSQVISTSGEPVNLMLFGTDVDGDSLSYRVVDAPTGGQVSGTAPDLVYTANNTFLGTDVVTFVANDGQLDSTLASITIVVSRPTGLEEEEEPDKPYTIFLPAVSR